MIVCQYFINNIYSISVDCRLSSASTMCGSCSFPGMLPCLCAVLLLGPAVLLGLHLLLCTSICMSASEWQERRIPYTLNRVRVSVTKIRIRVSFTSCLSHSGANTLQRQTETFIGVLGLPGPRSVLQRETRCSRFLQLKQTTSVFVCVFLLQVRISNNWAVNMS